jgi:hypothetical protein
MAGAMFAVSVVSGNASSSMHVTNGYLGCQSRDVQSKLKRLMIDRDKEAWTKLAAAGVITGQCHVFEAGDQVYLEETAMFSGVTCVRPPGEVACFWGPFENIK